MAFDEFKRVWNNVFGRQNEPPIQLDYGGGVTSYTSYSPHTSKFRFANERSTVTSIYTRISIDVAEAALYHIRLDKEKRYSEDIDSDLNTCLTYAPNIDQEPRTFRQNIVKTMLDTGCAVIIPVDHSKDPETGQMTDIQTMRVGEAVKWYPQHVRVNAYNSLSGNFEEVTLEKRILAIVENPFFDVMNKPNSTLQRLMRKLALLDDIDEQSGSGKLDLIIQLPYVVKSEARKLQAETRRQDIEFQLKGSKYGIAYTDGSEKITQLNRPAENNLLGQIEYLTKKLYGELAITESIMDGTADANTMTTYFNRTIEPILDAIIEAMQHAFIGRQRTAELEKIDYFRNPFKFVSLSDLGDVVDKLTRSEVVTSNEFRGFLKMKPSKEPRADSLANPNMPQDPNEPVA